VKPLFYLFACAMVTLGTSLSAFWIMVNNSWMQAPTGFMRTADGVFVPTDWNAIIFSPVVWVRFPHMLLASYVTGAFCIAAAGAWYLLRGKARAEGQAMIRMGLGLAAVLVPVQIFFGHLTGDYVHDMQPAKFAAIEGRWHDEQPASEILFAIPDEANERNRFEIAIPYAGSIIGSMSLDSKEVGLTDFPKADRPPVAIPFFAFRIMAGIGFFMLALAWGASWLGWRGQLFDRRWILRIIFLSFPLGFIATLMGWFTAEVGRQPWVVYGYLRTADAATPFLAPQQVAFSLALFATIYFIIFVAGMIFIFRLLRAGPLAVTAPPTATASRPLAFADPRDGAGTSKE